MINIHTIIGYLIVSTLWGCTNPFIKHAQVMSSNRDKELLASGSGANNHTNKSLLYVIKRFMTDFNMLIPFGLNQMGSVVFYLLLSTEPVSVASPVVNSMTFLFTAVTSYAVFNERVRYPWLLVTGTAFIIVGTAFCIMNEM